jgi:large subunit ribosomal protein L20
MPRVRIGSAKTQKHKKLLKKVRGYRGAMHRLYRVAIETYMKAGRYSAHGRKVKKRDYRGLWITRINAACRMRGMPYNRFMAALKAKGIELNRKMLSEIAIADPAAFDHIMAMVTGTAPAQIELPTAEVKA